MDNVKSWYMVKVSYAQPISKSNSSVIIGIGQGSGAREKYEVD